MVRGCRARCIAFDRIAGDKDDRYGRGRCLRRQSCGGGCRYDYRYAAANEISGKRRYRFWHSQ
jgi:hypothetical protein